jgi:hypothetical protein
VGDGADWRMGVCVQEFVESQTQGGAKQTTLPPRVVPKRRERAAPQLNILELGNEAAKLMQEEDSDDDVAVVMVTTESKQPSGGSPATAASRETLVAGETTEAS